MDETVLIGTIENFDRRLEPIEQILPTFATKEELHSAIAKLVTKEELRAAVATLATQQELRADVSNLTAKEKLELTRADLGVKIERMRLESRVQYESLRDDIRAVAKVVVSIQTGIEETVRPLLANHERRISGLELFPPAGHRRHDRR